MKSFLDFEEKSVEKAIQKACEDLNVSREKLKYDIISHGSSGIFGLVGAKKALIRVFVPDLPNHPSPQEISSATVPDAPQSKTEMAQTDRETVSALVDEAFGESREPIREPASPKKSRKPRKNQKLEKKVSAQQPKQSEKKEKIELTDTAEKRENAEKVEESAESLAVPVSERPPMDEVPKLPANPEAALAVARELAEKIFIAMEMAAEISLKPDSEPCGLNLKVSEPGALIGKRGQTLEAIQYLVDKVVNKQCGKGSRVIVDVDGYVESRKTELKELATRLASKTLKSGKPSTMTRMNAHDRRIVHIALKRNPAVRTQSVGDGYYRKLIIFPRKKTRQKADAPKATD